MLKKLIIIIAVTSGLLLAIVWLDHWGCLKFVWNKTLPEVILKRNLSSQERLRISLQGKINETQRNIQELNDSSSENHSRQKELESKLIKKLDGQRISEHMVMDYLEKNPIIAVLIRSIDATIITQQEIQIKIKQNQKSLEDLFARRLALDNGVSTITSEYGPSDAIEAESSDFITERQRYLEIMNRNGALIVTAVERR